MSSTRDPQPLTAGHRAPAGDRAAVERMAGAGAAAYGELLPAGARATLGWLRLGPQDELLDLGSGSGNLVIQAALDSDFAGAGVLCVIAMLTAVISAITSPAPPIARLPKWTRCHASG